MQTSIMRKKQTYDHLKPEAEKEMWTAQGMRNIWGMMQMFCTFIVAVVFIDAFICQTHTEYFK